nr:cytochrome P450 3A41-like [Cherax quadricarinatus]
MDKMNNLKRMEERIRDCNAENKVLTNALGKDKARLRAKFTVELILNSSLGTGLDRQAIRIGVALRLAGPTLNEHSVSMEVWLFVAGLVLVAYVYSRWCHSYWSSHGIRTPPFLPFLGHMHKKLPIFQSRWDYYDEVYHKYGGASLCGLYDLFRPVLMIGDPVLVKGILVKDFEHFVDREIFRAEEGSITNETLTRKSGDEWKALRAIMTPTFTSGKIRGMFPLVCNKADTLVSFTLKEAAQKPYVDMKDIFGRFTMDTIASCAFGIECNSFKIERTRVCQMGSSFF